MEHGPFEDVSPTKNGDIPASYVSLPQAERFQDCHFGVILVMRWQVPTLLTHLARSLNEGSPDVRFLNAKVLFVFFQTGQQKTQWSYLL